MPSLPLPGCRWAFVWSRRLDQAFGVLTLQFLQMVAQSVNVVSELLRNRSSNRPHLINQGVGRGTAWLNRAHSS